MTPKIPDPWTSYLQALDECSAAPAPSSVVTCGANFIVKDVVQVPSQVQGNIFSYLGQLSNTDLVVLLAERFFVASIESKGKQKLFLSRFI